jgi:hypothetical protein
MFHQKPQAMKTKQSASMTGGMVPLILAAVMLLATTGCGEDPYILYGDSEDPYILYGDSIEPETEYSGNVMYETFWVDPEGSSVNLFNGAVSMNFPEGAVLNRTEFTLYTFPVHHLDFEGKNMYNRGYSLEGQMKNKIFPNGVTFRARYDMAEQNWKKSAPAAEENLTIFYISPKLCAYERIISIDDCCVDCDCKIVKGSIRQCGFYVVGEN